MAKVTQIDHYKRRWTLNTGVIIFGIFFVYLVVEILVFLTDSHVTAYEVREGSIVRDTSYTGFAVRSESLYHAEDGGYINYFATEGNKVGAKTKVYSLSDQELNFANASSQEQEELTRDEQESILLRTQSFSENFTDSQFSDVYTLKTELEDILESKSSQSRKNQLEMMQEQGIPLTVYNAASDGVIVYATDGYEEVTVDEVTPAMVEKKDYKLTNLREDNQLVKSGDPIYKLVTEDAWSLVILLDEDTAEELAETNVLTVRFSKDQETTKAAFSIRQEEDSYLGILTFSSSMIRYVQDRYVDIELILEDESGLKIPKSAVVERDFYTVPEDYLTMGGDSSAEGLILETEEGEASFTSVTVYYRDHDAGLIYLSEQDVENGTKIYKPDSEEIFTVDETATLSGVYNINKGYTVFKRIDILCESDEYYIVTEGSDYGLANYDRIALDGEAVTENEVVY